MSDPYGIRRSKAYGLSRNRYLSNLHRVTTGYFKPRTRRRNTASSNRKSHTAHPILRRERKIVPWLPGDDYLLINSVIRTCNLSEVYHTVRFATFYTEKQIESRWRALLFDPAVAETALKAISRIPPVMKAQLDRLVPFSSAEDNLLVRLTFLDVFPDGILRPMLPADLRKSIFAKLLREHPSVFYAGRDEVDLFRQWSRLQSCHVIPEGHLTDLRDYSNTPSDSSSPEVSLRRSHSIPDDLGLSDVDDKLGSTLGGDPESFSDTELLLTETVGSALSAGLEKLTETSTASRRQRMLNEPSYHGFQSLVTESVLAALVKERRETINDTVLNPESPRIPLHETYSSGIQDTNVSSKFMPPNRPGDRVFWPSSSYRRDRNPTALLRQDTDFDFQRRLEIYRRRRRLWARLRRTAEEAKRWTRLVEIRAASGLEITDSQPIYPALAAFTGSRTRFLIKEKEVTFGRSSFVYKPHIDLSCEGDTSRVSRCHGRIRLLADGTFWLANFSQHPVFVDGNPVLTDEEIELKDLATVIIAHLIFRFEINHLYVNGLCNGGSSISSDLRNEIAADPNVPSPPATHPLDDSNVDDVPMSDGSMDDTKSCQTLNE
ncbi:unnamed protein product [Calicophoron daubneyi]|uniref:FHA domain-containing protein n=1 Tax=Calicophoron daubneyi TaxID=300641 RepID=A0AAV2TF57_CALDB